MARFLSPEWLDALAAAARGHRLPEAAADVDLAVRQVVRATPGGDVAYTVRFHDGGVTVTPDADGTADVEVAQDYDTAAAISRGELSPVQAFADGRLTVAGGVAALAGHGDLLAGLGDVFADVRDGTEY